MPEYDEFEQEIEAILDLFSLEVGTGIQIKEESFLFSSATWRDNEFKNSRLVEPSKTRELYLQFSKLETENNKKLRLALRLYRQSVSTNDTREQMAKLFAALEQLFSDGEGRMLDKEEIDQIRGAMERLPLSTEKKEIILARVCDIRKSPKTKIAEKLELMYEKEQISEGERNQLAGTWNKYRSAITHGEIVSKRDEDFDCAVSEIDTIVEAILKRSIDHRKKEIEKF